MFVKYLQVGIFYLKLLNILKVNWLVLPKPVKKCEKSRLFWIWKKVDFSRFGSNPPSWASAEGSGQKQLYWKGTQEGVARTRGGQPEILLFWEKLDSESTHTGLARPSVSRRPLFPIVLKTHELPLKYPILSRVQNLGRIII